MSSVELPRKGPPEGLDRTALRVPAPMRFADLYAPFDRFMAEAPEIILAMPSMMSDNERIFLYNIAKRYYRGMGRIVDAGIFLGGSTCCFAEGLMASQLSERFRPRWAKPILSLERAVVSATMPAFFARHGVGADYRQGDSFVDLLESYVAPYRDMVELRIGDILKCGSVDDKIEILFLDILKMPAIGLYAVSEYFPKLIPGRSIVIQQDYFFEGLPFIKTYQEFFSDEFEYIGEVGSSAIFRCRAKIEQSKIDEVIAGVSPDQQIKFASMALQRSHDPLRRLMMAMSKTLLIRDLKGKKAARQYLDVVEEDFSPFISDKILPRLKGPLRELQRLCDDSGD